MRVRVSVANGTVAVKENGSAFIVTDSKATARVSVGVDARLISVGALGDAAYIEIEAPRNIVSINRGRITPVNLPRRIEFFIGMDSVTFNEPTAFRSEIPTEMSGGGAPGKAYPVSTHYNMFDDHPVNNF